MRSIYRSYQNTIRSLNRHGTWLPSDILELGAVGVLNKGEFERKHGLARLGISPEFEDPSDENPEGFAEVFTHASASQVKAGAEFEAEFGPLASASIGFRFEKRGDYIISVRGLQQRRIANLEYVTEEILKLDQRNEWNRSWILITEIWAAASLNVLVSQTRNSRVAFAAKGGEALTIAELSNASLAVDVAFREGEFLHVQTTNATPFFRAKKVRPRFLRNNDVENISTRGSEGSDPPELLPLHFENDLMASWTEEE